ncbi:hypothetical protein F5Y11DRAFT_333860 [Daldinia sp. FL1419]|nr:hypothetical protein F5Y11DRAFT_333860 [Daldinia sp. FL1419]
MAPSFDNVEQSRELLNDVVNDAKSISHNEKLHPWSAVCPRNSGYKVLLIMLSTSILLNVIQFILSRRPLATIELPSRFAHLQRSHEEPYVLVTRYSSDNGTLRDQLWHDINIDSGVVALSDEWATQHGLRTAQRFPWDQSKGIYILHGFHNLHCLKIIYISLSEYRRGVPQSRSQHHINHCLDALRRQILCDADDTPRATERRAEVVSGLWQHRKCRSWESLETFAKQHTACYKRPENPEWDGKSKLERFKHCPPGSGYIPKNDYVSTDEFLIGLPSESLEDH